jgi:hypothetical protein
MKYIVTVRGKLNTADIKAAQKAHDATVDRLSPIGRPLGSVGHMAFLNPQDPQQFLAVDTWESMEGIQKFMEDAANPGAAIAALFDGPPEVTVWAEADGWRSF